ncbi:cupin domain-containing protein [Amycolatopsis taiwanensis]|uniref:Cupin n=1 Tax=Amycolatopsis taiwanensis TaxID=342230 RepID=A0A9W6QXQ7_9PSEU|nr:cupin domain-containing protein [Amycolatopsis taiwanensis]GLY63895.1 cupin [Amycolatopsis taiwanensis]
MPVILNADSRRTETPNAVMTTLASPTQGGSRQSVWRVDMTPGAAGPLHAFDTDQVWTVLDGGARINLADETVTVTSGDTVIMPADAQRQVFADDTHGMTAIVCAPASTRVYKSAPEAGVPACATLDGGKILPNWIA